MGISNQLTDVSSDSIPILIIVSWISSIRALLLSLLHSVGLSQPSDSSSTAAVGSGLAGLVLLADHISAASSAGSSAGSDGCVFCLEGLKEGDRIRRLPCCHVFHSECLDGWFVERMKMSCPLCRSPVAAAEERRAEAERRIGAELVAWLSPY